MKEDGKKDEKRDRSHASTKKWAVMGPNCNLYHGGVCRLGKLSKHESCAIVLFCTEASDLRPTLILGILGLHVELLPERGLTQLAALSPHKNINLNTKSCDRVG